MVRRKKLQKNRTGRKIHWLTCIPIDVNVLHPAFTVLMSKLPAMRANFSLLRRALALGRGFVWLSLALVCSPWWPLGPFYIILRHSGDYKLVKNSTIGTALFVCILINVIEKQTNFSSAQILFLHFGERTKVVYLLLLFNFYCFIESSIKFQWGWQNDKRWPISRPSCSSRLAVCTIETFLKNG